MLTNNTRHNECTLVLLLQNEIFILVGALTKQTFISVSLKTVAVQALFVFPRSAKLQTNKQYNLFEQCHKTIQHCLYDARVQIVYLQPLQHVMMPRINNTG